MTDLQLHPDTRDEGGQTEAIPEETLTTDEAKKKKSLSMHEGIAVWCDCCSCEAEPYWVEIAEELGVDLGSDYEDDDTQAQRDR